jgi:hypothetical protein
VTEINDGYDTYYAERLWQLLPAVYRTADADSSGASPGPLRELVNRIGVQVAVVRRSIDRLWADQSIETCDNWVIPYIGDLLGTNLISNLGPPAQRLDVANTIHYRRRKGTVEVLEELAYEVTAINGMRWIAHVVEGFRRLARSRHGLDPALGPAAFPNANAAEVAQLLQIEGLTGLLTGGPSGGFADLRSRHGAALAHTAFDESFHMTDVRAGRGAVGHFGIAKLLVFLWRLTRFQVPAGTPVQVAGCPGQYVFDPTGREIPLFLFPLPPSLAADDFSGSWTPAREWQVPGLLTSSLQTAITDGGASPPPPARPPYPDAVPPGYQLATGWQLTSIWPETGRFAAAAESGSPPAALTVDYSYGFSSMIGAGPYDRALLGTPPGVTGRETIVTGGGQGLSSAPAEAGTSGTITIGDPDAPAESPTYTTLPDIGSSAEPIVSMLVRAGPGMRPVLRPAAGADPWVFTGGGEAELVLDGLTISGCDIVLRGSFRSVRITACTVDPGTAAAPGSTAEGAPPLATAADGAVLAPCRIFIEADPTALPGNQGAIAELLIDHCILGPVRTRFGGSVETLAICDSIVQGLPATAGAAYTAADVFDPQLLARGLLAAEPLSQALLSAMPDAVGPGLLSYLAGSTPSAESSLPQDVLDGLNTLVNGPSLYDSTLFGTVSLSAGVLALAGQAAQLAPAQLAALNRVLLDESFPVALGVAALAVADAEMQLTRVTVLGRTAAHRLQASDSILGAFAVVDDVQSGGVRYSAYASDSALPRQYASAAIPPGAPLFTSSSYGQPGYAQLLETADTSITGGADGASISAGAENGSEMGAFSADLNPLREQGLLTKYAEYMPLGLTPVIIHVT